MISQGKDGLKGQIETREFRHGVQDDRNFDPVGNAPKIRLEDLGGHLRFIVEGRDHQPVMSPCGSGLVGERYGLMGGSGSGPGNDDSSLGRRRGNGFYGVKTFLLGHHDAFSRGAEHHVA